MIKDRKRHRTTITAVSPDREKEGSDSSLSQTKINKTEMADNQI